MCACLRVCVLAVTPRPCSERVLLHVCSQLCVRVYKHTHFQDSICIQSSPDLEKQCLQVFTAPDGQTYCRPIASGLKNGDGVESIQEHQALCGDAKRSAEVVHPCSPLFCFGLFQADFPLSLQMHLLNRILNGAGRFVLTLTLAGRAGACCDSR